MPRLIDLVGKKFNRLTVISRAENKGQYVHWNCICDCGNTRTTSGECLKKGHTKSCGCLRVERIARKNTTHGLTKTSEYKSWASAKDRCYNHSNPKYPRYGGRGIIMCDRWKNSFESFFADMGNKPSPTHSVDRRDNDGNYEPENCHWATPLQQGRNKSNNRILTLNNKSMTVSQWSAKLGIKYQTLSMRVNKYNWSDEKALTTPIYSRIQKSA